MIAFALTTLKLRLKSQDFSVKLFQTAVVLLRAHETAELALIETAKDVRDLARFCHGFLLDLKATKAAVFCQGIRVYLLLNVLLNPLRSMQTLIESEEGGRVADLYRTISDKKFFSLTEVAVLCKVTPAAALYWCRQGKMRVQGRTSARGKYRISRKEVLRVLSQRRVEVPGLWSAKKRILVIDDFVPTANLIRIVLEHAGVPVEVRAARTVGDGLVAAGSFKPHIIFVDYGNPADELQGLHALAAIREASLLRKTRVIGMATDPACESEMLAAGAAAFLRKPLQHLTTVDLVKKAAPSHRKRR